MTLKSKMKKDLNRHHILPTYNGWFFVVCLEEILYLLIVFKKLKMGVKNSFDWDGKPFYLGINL